LIARQTPGEEDTMRMSIRRETAQVTLARGRKRSIRPDGARDEDLHVFLHVSRASRRAIGQEIDQLLGRA
jgi:hypothetical protein